MVICKPGSVKPHKKFKAEVYILKKEEEEDDTPFHNNYRPYLCKNYWCYWKHCPAKWSWNGYAWWQPYDYCWLISPIAYSVGLRFAIREGRTVGAGQVMKIIE